MQRQMLKKNAKAIKKKYGENAGRFKLPGS